MATNIDTAITELCEAGARALHRYATVSGEDPSTLPEYFMSAFIFNDIGDRITLTLETPFSKLSEWNNDGRRRLGLPPQSQEETEALLKLAEDIGAPRVDMVMFTGEDGIPKDEQNFLALVEFKRWDIERGGDRSKILRILRHIDTCNYGVACGFARDDHVEWQKEKAQECRDFWCQREMPPLVDEPKYFFCARVFDRSAADGITDPKIVT